MFVGRRGGPGARPLRAGQATRRPASSSSTSSTPSAKSRAGASGFVGGHDEREQTLNQLAGRDGRLRLLQGRDHHGRHQPARGPGSGAPAAGRFDRQVVVDKPDVRGREAILRTARPRASVLAPGSSLRRHRRAHARLRGRRPGQHRERGGALLAARKEEERRRDGGLRGGDRSRGGRAREEEPGAVSEKERDIVAHHEMGHALVRVLGAPTPILCTRSRSSRAAWPRWA